MINKDTYEKMKELVKEYEDNLINPKTIDLSTIPYLKEYSVETSLSYNKHFGDDKVCECGHEYHRHFDSYENMEAVGCKYCGCYCFDEK